MFETLKTALKIIVAGLTYNKLLIIGFVALALMVVWSVTCLIFNSQVRLKKDCYKLIKYLKENSISAENYGKFVNMLNGFPKAFRLAWKRYETSTNCKPADFINQNECIDLPLSGGMQKQNRSLMRTVIGVVVGFVALCSLALATSPEVGLTTVVVDALIVPFVLYLLLMINYYVYTAIRHHQYVLLVDVFYDLVDVLNDKVCIKDIFGSDTKSIGLVCNVYTNDTMEALIEEARRNRNKNIALIEQSGCKLSPLKTGILGVDDVNDTTSENVIQTDKIVSNKLAEENTDISIKTESEFVETIEEVENMLKLLDSEKNKQKRLEIENAVNEKMRALTEYKQKAKNKTVKKSSNKGN